MLCFFQSLALVLGFEKAFQNGNEQHTHDAGGEAAVVQQEAAVQDGDVGNDAVVEHSCKDTANETIFARYGSQSIGKAQTNNDGLRVDAERKGFADDRF